MPQNEQEQVDELSSIADREQSSATDTNAPDSANSNTLQAAKEEAGSIVVHTMPKEFLGAKEKKMQTGENQGTLQKPPKMGNKKFLIILMTLLILFIGGGVAAYVVLIRGKDTNSVVIAPPIVEPVVVDPVPTNPVTPVEGGNEGNEGNPDTGNGEEPDNGNEDQTVSLLGEDLVQKVVVSYNNSGSKTTEAVLSLEHEDTVNYSKITITEHIAEKKPEYFEFIAAQAYEVRLRGETPSAKSVLSITFTQALLEKLDLIPADLRIGFLPFTRLDEELYRPSSPSASLLIASAHEDLNNEPATAVEDATDISSDKDKSLIDDNEKTDNLNGVQIWEILKAQDLDDNMYSISSVLQGVRDGIYAIVPINVNDLITLPEKPEIDEPTDEPSVENGEIVVGLDSDMDLLTDKEELLYGTSPLVADSDLDGYNDGTEVLGLFSPARGKGVALADDTQFARYVHSEYQHTVIYPKQFTPKPLVEDANKDIIFVGPGNESILMSIQDNKEGLDLQTWVLSLSSGIDISKMEEITTKGGFAALGIANKTAYYLQVPGSPFVYVFSYTSPDEYNYLTTIRMMLESFTSTNDSIPQ